MFKIEEDWGRVSSPENIKFLTSAVANGRPLPL